MPYRLCYTKPVSDKCFKVEPWHSYIVVAELSGRRKKHIKSVQVRLPLASPSDEDQKIISVYKDNLNKLKEVISDRGHMIIYGDVWTCAAVEQDPYFWEFIGIHPFPISVKNTEKANTQMKCMLGRLHRSRNWDLYVEFFETGPAIHSEKLMELAGEVDAAVEKFKLEAKRTGKLPRAFVINVQKKTFDYPGWRQLPGMANYNFVN